MFSFRDEFGQWDPKNQRPELWNLYNARVNPGEHVRVFPISNWTELDVWQYIEREQLDLPSLYFAHRRAVFRRNGLVVAVTRRHAAEAGRGGRGAERALPHRGRHDLHLPGGIGRRHPRRDRGGDRAQARITERGATRMDDQTSDASMERRKKEGYF